MPGIRESLDPVGHARLARFLARASAGMFTGTLRAAGHPGGTLHLRYGRVASGVSPGAPGVRALLVRTGRVADEEWARSGGAVDRAVAVGRIGAAHLSVIELMATQDALFAMLAGSIDACVLEDGPPAPGGRGEEPAALLLTAFRKLDALAMLPQAILPHRERLAPVLALPRDGDQCLAGDRELAGDSISVRENVLRYADGRRTARDVAFLSGRSLYAVTVEMSRMLSEGLLRETPPPPVEAAIADLPLHLVPRASQPRPAVAGRPATSRPELPRRQSQAADLAEDTATQKTAAFWRDLLRLGGTTGEGRTLSTRQRRAER